MNPYYTVFFAPAIEDKLKVVGEIYKKYGYIEADLDSLTGRDLGLAAAQGMVNLSKDIGFPTKLSNVPGISQAHIDRCLTAAKNPVLDMKLRNMPVSLNAELVDEYMGPHPSGRLGGKLQPDQEPGVMIGTDQHRLIGREREMRLLLAALGAGRHVLIEGPVGVGKTRLAEEAAARLGRQVVRLDADERFSEEKLTGWFDPPLVIESGYTDRAFPTGAAPPGHDPRGGPVRQ